MRPNHSEQASRVKHLFEQRTLANFRKTDRLFAGLMLFQWVVGVVIALWISPRTWSGPSSQTHLHVWAALFLGAAIISLPLWLIFTRPGEAVTRHCVAVAQMLTSALLIHLTGGRIETHFHIFGSIAFLALYRDWPVLITATLTVALDHLVRGIFWPQSVYGVLSASYLRFLEHAGWVVFEVFFLTRACMQSVAETRTICEKRIGLETANEALRSEIEERTAAQNALFMSEERFRMVASATRDTIWDRDLENNTVWRNENFDSTTGFSANEAGQELDWWMERVHPEDRDTISSTIAQAIAGGDEQWTGEYRFCRKDGSYASILDRGRIIRDSEGKATRMVGAMTDLSRLRELQEATETADAATRAKSEFLANMSHEIRTPLNGIIGMTQLALDTQLNAEQQEYLLAVEHSSQALLSVINDVLDFSKIEARRLEFDSIEFNLRETVEDALKAIALAAHRKGLELACRIPADMPVCVVGDPGRLRQIIINLAGNAIKFTKQGEVILQVQRETADHSGSLLHFSISDTGVGIPREKQDLIFEAFAQADNSVSREYGGTGLGLAISAALVKMMHGKIWLESEVGKGSTFHFTAMLPIANSVPNDTSSQSVHLNGLRVLVVDDNKTNRRILQEMLASWEIPAECVDGGRAALEALKGAKESDNAPFSLVLTDAHMPDIDGFELALRLKHDTEVAQPPILMLTSDMQRGDSARCRKLGITNYLVKPVRQSDLFDAIVSSLGVRKAPHVLTKSIESAATAAMFRPLSVLLAEDNPVNQTLAIKILQKHGHTVRVAASGEEVVTLSQREDFDVILMDVQMPGMDGFQATALIREQETGRQRTPIIALTAHAMKGDRERCLEAGMDGYVAKPIRPAELFEEINAVLPAELEPALPKLSPMPSAESLFDLTELHDRIGRDEEFLRELIELFVSEETTLRAQISAAIAAKDAESVERAAHILKGSLSSFSPKIAIQPAAALEAMGRARDLSGAEAVFSQMTQELDMLELALVSMMKQDSPCRCMAIEAK